MKKDKIELIRKSGCTRCRTTPTYNRRTLRRLAESDREIELDIANRKNGGCGTMRAFSNLDELFADLHSL